MRWEPVRLPQTACKLLSTQTQLQNQIRRSSIFRINYENIDLAFPTSDESYYSRLNLAKSHQQHATMEANERDLNRIYSWIHRNSFTEGKHSSYVGTQPQSLTLSFGANALFHHNMRHDSKKQSFCKQEDGQLLWTLRTLRNQCHHHYANNRSLSSSTILYSSSSYRSDKDTPAPRALPSTIEKVVKFLLNKTEFHLNDEDLSSQSALFGYGPSPGKVKDDEGLEQEDRNEIRDGDRDGNRQPIADMDEDSLTLLTSLIETKLNPALAEDPGSEYVPTETTRGEDESDIGLRISIPESERNHISPLDMAALRSFSPNRRPSRASKVQVERLNQALRCLLLQIPNIESRKHRQRVWFPHIQSVSTDDFLTGVLMLELSCLKEWKSWAVLPEGLVSDQPSLPVRGPEIRDRMKQPLSLSMPSPSPSPSPLENRDWVAYDSDERLKGIFMWASQLPYAPLDEQGFIIPETALVPLDVYSITTVLTAGIKKCKTAEQALQMFDWIFEQFGRRYGLSPNHISYDALAAICMETTNWTAFLQLLALMSRNDRAPTRFTVFVAISLWIRMGRRDYAEILLGLFLKPILPKDAMPEFLTQLLPIDTSSALVPIRNWRKKKIGPQHLTLLLSHFSDTRSVSNLLRAAHWFALMMKTGIPPNIMTYSVMIRFLGQMKFQECAVALVSDVLELRLPLGVKAAEVMLRTCAAAGEVELAFTIFGELQRSRATISRRGNRVEPSQGSKPLTRFDIIRMNAKREPLTLTIYLCLIYTCASGKQPNRGFVVYEALKISNIPLDFRVYMALATLCQSNPTEVSKERIEYVLGRLREGLHHNKMEFADGMERLMDVPARRYEFLFVEPEQIQAMIQSLEEILASKC